MDKKNTFLGILFIAVGIGFMAWQSKQAVDRQREQPPPGENAAEQAAPQPGSVLAQDASPGASVAAPTTDASPGSSISDLIAESVERPEPVTPAGGTATAEPEVLEVLENDFIRVHFTNRGGAIKRVEFKQTKRGGEDDYVFNDHGYLPALSLSLNGSEGGLAEFAPAYRVARESSDSIEFVLDAGDLQILRAYTISSEGDQPYVIAHSTRISNRSDAPVGIRTVHVNLGTALPTAGDKMGFYLNAGHFDGNKAKFIKVKEFKDSSGFLGIGARRGVDEVTVAGPFEWTSVKNQFFASVLMAADRNASDIRAYPVPIPEAADTRADTGVTASVGYELGIVDPSATEELAFEFYVGPKEYVRLQALGNEQDRVMQFGFFGGISKLLLIFMHAIHKVVPNWGWSIVIMTVIIKLLFWPLTAKASQSQKRMAKIQGPMAELKEKYKDNPQKLQQETLKLFRENRVNPAAGCLPIFIQMPIFLGLFYMLRTASELRFASFLWVQDLSQPDTLMMIGGFPLNVLPLLMGASMFFQMRMVPVSPSADPVQQKVFKFLPFVFLVFLYNFSSGLVLYWTVQNLLTILQQWITNRRTDDEPEPAAAAPAKPRSGAPRAKAAKKRKR